MVSGEALLAFLGDRLARYKLPRTVEHVDDVLRDDAGKVRRSELRRQRLGAGDRAGDSDGDGA